MLRLQSDERLIALTRRGQHAAFEVVCARYQSRLLSFCRHMLASREDAEDVLQEVFAAAFNAVLADERPINVRPWLYRIARNRSLNHLRRASAIGVDSMDVHFAEGGISTGEKVLRRESFRELIEDVHHLPETQRTALLLREIDALSYEQIAHAMETTVPSVKSLLVRARISLAEAAEARKLSCEEVRLELGEVAEGLSKLGTPARRHVRDCERCKFFRKQLKDNNHALAIIMPVGPLLLFKKLLLAKLGTTASAGGAHVAGSAGATVGATATATATATAGAGAAGGSVAGGIMTAGAGALATKAVAGLAVAAIVTAGAVATDNAVVVHHHHPHLLAATSVGASHYASVPLVVHQALQPVSAGTPAGAALARRDRHRAKSLKAAATPTPPASAPLATTGAAAAPAAKPTVTQPVTEVTTQTTELPAAATTVPSTSAGTTTTVTATTPTTGSPTSTGTTTTTPTTPSQTTPTTPAETPSAPTQNTTTGADADADATTGTTVPQTTVSAPEVGGTEAPSATGGAEVGRNLAHASRRSASTARRAR